MILEKTFASHISGKGLIFEINKGYLQTNKNKRNNTIKNGGIELTLFQRKYTNGQQKY